MRLHEHYFGNMARGGTKAEAAPKLMKKLAEDFGSYENWEKDFRGVGSMRGIGWAVLYYDPAAKRLFNAWINEHDSGHLAGASPILVMDVFEHAFMLDYGLKRADYISSFFKNLDWKEAETRFAKAGQP
jgi:Fe-Mn family superoxide dismutase